MDAIAFLNGWTRISLEALGWIGSGLLFISMVISIKRRHWLGPAIGFVGEGLWTYVAYEQGQMNLFTICCVFTLGYAWGVYEWGKSGS